MPNTGLAWHKCAEAQPRVGFNLGRVQCKPNNFKAVGRFGSRVRVAQQGIRACCKWAWSTG